MNDISRTTDFDLTRLTLREPWWRQTGQRLRHSRLAAVVLVLLALAVLGGLAWFLAHRSGASQGFGANRRFRAVATVGVTAATRADVPIYLDALGTVTPLATAVVQAQVSGVLTRVYYREGQTVKAGEPLVQIDPRPFQIALEQAQGSLQRDEANLANQRVIVQRDRVLLSQDSIAQQQVDTDEATAKQLQGVVSADRAAVDSARLNLTYSRVTAPITGRVGLRPLDVGNFITSSEPNGIATITQLTPIDVEFALPAEDVSRVQKRIAAGAVLPVIALDQTRTVKLADGTFLTLDNQIDTQTGTIHAKARFANAQGTMFPQQFVNVRLLLDTLRDAVVVPSAAVREGPQGTYVYVVSPDHIAHVRLVKTGPSVADRISIASGLQAGEEVVTEGGDRLVDGAKVRLPGDIPEKGQSTPMRKQAASAGGGRHGRRS
ncbi:MAG: efflux RND transporter periplasmic adaptor subunit [Steroidobacteraceae bacterium]